MPHLFDELKIRETTFANRIFVSPMCQYSCVDGFATDWHLVHLGSRAVGGAALVFTEATAVLADGRISPQDLGIWKDEHIEMLARITAFLRQEGSVTGIQLAHAGRKASTFRPWDGNGVIPESQGGWKNVVAPSAITFAESYASPRALTIAEIKDVVQAFAAAAARACAAGFQVAEIHAAHGYLLHEFLSPFSNQRTDEYGGSFENRTHILREVVSAVRRVWPEGYPVFVRISATDWKEGGWDLEQSVELARQLQPLGVDLVDCSTGGNLPHVKIPNGPGYQVEFAAEIRRQTGILTGAVGLITSAAQAEQIVSSGKADAVLLAREMLREPYFPLHAAQQLGAKVSWPSQYLRAAPEGTPTRSESNLEAVHECFAEQHAVVGAD